MWEEGSYRISQMGTWATTASEYFNIWVIAWKEIHASSVVTAMKNELYAVLWGAYICLLQVESWSKGRSLNTQCETHKGCVSDSLRLNCLSFSYCLSLGNCLLTVLATLDPVLGCLTLCSCRRKPGHFAPVSEFHLEDMFEGRFWCMLLLLGLAICLCLERFIL